MAEVKDYPPYLDHPKSYKPQTNADKIRAMSDEELRDFLCTIVPMREKLLLRWLKSPIEEG